MTSNAIHVHYPEITIWFVLKSIGLSTTILKNSVGLFVRMFISFLNSLNSVVAFLEIFNCSYYSGCITSVVSFWVLYASDY